MATMMLSDATYDRLRAHAEADGRTVEEEIQVMIDERSKARQVDLHETLRLRRKYLREKYGELPDSLTLIRQVRDEE